MQENNTEQKNNTEQETEQKREENDIFESITLDNEYNIEEDISETLSRQVNEELNLQKENHIIKEEISKNSKRKRTKNNILLALVLLVFILLLSSVWLVGTKSGRNVIYNIAGRLIHSRVDKVEEENPPELPVYISDEQPEKEEVIEEPVQEEEEEEVVKTKIVSKPRSEAYVMNFLIYGIEEFEDAKNTDAMLMVSINTKDSTIKLTSLLRDTYIEIPGKKPTKLNAVYGNHGAGELIEVIETNYLIEIDGYAHVNFDSFERIIDDLGGISIELGEEEAHYLNTTNYISERKNRTVVPGWNVLNGNQALGYCRVRKCVTLGGANDDYGRTLRQRRVLNAIFQKYKSRNFFDLISITNSCLGNVKTNVSAKQIEDCLKAIVENKIRSMKTSRIPANGYFDDPSRYNGVDSPLVLEWDKNIIELYRFVFLDSKEEAKKALSEHRWIEYE